MHFFAICKLRLLPSPVCDSVGADPELSAPSDAGQLPGQMAAAGGPLRAEGFPKRRCQFEFVAAKPHLNPIYDIISTLLTPILNG